MWSALKVLCLARRTYNLSFSRVEGHEFFVMGAIVPGGIDCDLPACGVIETRRSDFAGIVVVIDFPCPRGKVSVLLEELRQSERIRNRVAEICLEVPDLCRIWRQSGHE